MDEVSRICDILPKKDKDEIYKLVKVTSIMKQKLNQATEDIQESWSILINIAEEIELAKLEDLKRGLN